MEDEDQKIIWLNIEEEGSQTSIPIDVEKFKHVPNEPNKIHVFISFKTLESLPNQIDLAIKNVKHTRRLRENK